MVAGTGGGGEAETGVSVLSTTLPAFFHLSVMLATLLSSADPTNICKRVPNVCIAEVLPKGSEARLVVLCVLVATKLGCINKDLER